MAEDDIKINSGDNRILLIAPHGVATKPRDDINTDQLTYRIAERLKCSAIVNDVYKRTGLDFNDIANASTHETFIPTIREVVDAPGPTLVVWVHGIDDDNLKREIVEMGVEDDVQCLIGYGQPDRPTAEKKTVDDLIKMFGVNSIIAHVARVGSNYGGNSTRFMNQWFRENGYKLADVQSVQLEFKHEGVRRSKDLDEASQNISNALSGLNET
ncbi:MAG: hypothetical protein JRD87_08145 [Deltaproteobacteria bacterium]|nr:hypothetical protein [Deltaproteobacteria bacterium]MBW2669846.1 hypothetical protein [Deltaproteobacteria bacterium]